MISDIRTVHFRVVRDKEKSRLEKAIVSSLHFQNILILLLKENYELFKCGNAQNFHEKLLNRPFPKNFEKNSSKRFTAMV